MKIVWEDSEKTMLGEKTKTKLEKEFTSLAYEAVMIKEGDGDSEGIIVHSLLQLAIHLGVLDAVRYEFDFIQQRDNPEEYYKTAWWRGED